ncbi:hypothetical protein F5X98DRAFT_327558 [Xylaria grammica]|nr:hypothetical protein F5X98DRAFT_327558 [Xylaria grammica]
MSPMWSRGRFRYSFFLGICINRVAADHKDLLVPAYTKISAKASSQAISLPNGHTHPSFPKFRSIPPRDVRQLCRSAMDSPLYEGLWPSVIAAIISSCATIVSAVIVARSSTITPRHSSGDPERGRKMGSMLLRQGYYAHSRGGAFIEYCVEAHEC